HTGAVGDEHVRHIPALIVRVEHGRLGILPHARRTHLVDHESGRIVARVRLNLVRARLGEHLRGGDGHVVEQRLLIFAIGAADPGDRNAPGIDLVLVDLDEILFLREHLAEAVESESPRTRLAQRLLEIGAEARLPRAAAPVGAAGATLEPVPPQERRLAFADVTEARHVNPVGPVADRVAIDGRVDAAVRAAAHDVIHQVLADLPAGIRDPREQEDPRRLDRGRAQEHDPRLELDRVLRLAVNHTHTGRPASLAVGTYCVLVAVLTAYPVCGTML